MLWGPFFSHLGRHPRDEVLDGTLLLGPRDDLVVVREAVHDDGDS